MMRKKLLIILVLCGTIAKAQDDKTTYTDEELLSYATVMTWAENEQGKMSEALVERIKSDPLVAPVYNDLKEAYGDADKLAGLGISDDQVAAYESILAFEDSIKSSFKEVYIGKIKGDIGASLYNKLKKSLKSDDEVKTRYDEIVAGLKETDVEEETEDMD